MRGMRKLRENLPNRVYHLIGRMAHRAFFLNAEERARFVELLKRVAAFSGIELLAYCVMANHVHILVFVPEPEELSDEEVLSRMRILYRDSRFAVHKPDSLGEAGAVMMTAAYVDLNPVKAGIVSDVDTLADYEWGSYHDACAGDRSAIAGYDLIYRGRGRPWRELKALHRISLNMAAKELAAREAEEEGLAPKSVPTLRRERKDALRFSRAELKEPERVPVLIESGNNQLARNLLKLIAKNGPMRPVELRDALGIASRTYFTLKYLSPLAAGGYIAPVGKGSPSSSRRAYKLTRKGKEVAQW